MTLPNNAIETDAFAAALPLRCAAHRERWASLTE
jgi:hypothetical protein